MGTLVVRRRSANSQTFQDEILRATSNTNWAWMAWIKNCTRGRFPLPGCNMVYDWSHWWLFIGFYFSFPRRYTVSRDMLDPPNRGSPNLRLTFPNEDDSVLTHPKMCNALAPFQMQKKGMGWGATNENFKGFQNIIWRFPTFWEPISSHVIFNGNPMVKRDPPIKKNTMRCPVKIAMGLPPASS